MKKFIFIFIIFTLSLTLIMSSGCFIQEKREFNKTKEEIIKFDEEYWNLVQDNRLKCWNYMRKSTSLSLSPYKTVNLDEGISATIDKLNFNIDLANKRIEMKDNYLECYLSYVFEFKALTIPSKLDNFYYEKIKQFERYIESYQKDILADLSQLQCLEYFKNGVENNFANEDFDFANKSADERDALYIESEALYKQARDLSTDCDKIRREIYREYELDELIKKWQDQTIWQN